MNTGFSPSPITLDGCHLYVDGNDHPIQLRPMEAKLLAVLLKTPNTVVPRATIMREVWQTDFLGDTRTLDVHISWLRRKIQGSPGQPQRLVTVRGVGYSLVVI